MQAIRIISEHSMTKMKSVLTAGLIAISILNIAGIAFAQGTIANVPITRVGPGTVGGLADLLRAIVRWVYIGFFILAVFFILYAAFLYLTAAGNDEAIGRAKKVLIYAVVAIVIAFLAVGFETIIGTFLTNPSA